MNGISPWHSAALAVLVNDALPIIFENTVGNYTFKVLASADAIYVDCTWKNGRITFRPVYSPDGTLFIKRKQLSENGIKLSLDSTMGTFKVSVEIKQGDDPMLNYRVQLTPKNDLHIPFWPRDIIFTNQTQSKKPLGTAQVKQVGARSGLLYVTLETPKAGSFLYFQNLTSLGNYNEATKTSAAETVGGIWPELGFSLPPTKDDPLKKGSTYTISDAIIAFDETPAESETQLAAQYLNLLAAVYLEMPKPVTAYNDWLGILEKGLHDLTEAPGCWSQVAGKRYFNAYVSDYETPPEIMVQLAVLLPLFDYTEWSGKKLAIMKDISDGLPTFWSEKLKTIVRWLPAAEGKLKGEEEQKQPMVMDSWYLHHPLLNLSRLAIKGDQTAAKLFLDSLGYATKVAKHFNYEWPVFYKMDTLEVIKAETKPGEGGQHDVAGLYAHVLLQAFELTGEKKYLTEAERAAKTLAGKGFKLFYQANNTAFSAGALLRLYKITKKEIYLELSNLCLAGVFQNVKLWACNYGYGKNFPNFFALFPLSDAPYTAVYEEQEVFCALHDYLEHAKDVSEVLPSIKLLASEYIRYLVHRAPYYYPPMLTDEMLSDEVKVGEVDRKLWIALEDLHDGWEKNGEVGQEVYGAGNAFGILPRHYHLINDELTVFCDYPISSKRQQDKNTLILNIAGDRRIDCYLRIIPLKGNKKYELADQKGAKLKATKTKDGHFEYKTKGEQRIRLTLGG